MSTMTMEPPTLPAGIVLEPLTPQGNGAVAASKDLWEKAVCLSISISTYGNTKKLPEGLVQVDADEGSIKSHKVLVQSAALKKINHQESEIKMYLGTRCLPSLFRNGIFLVPIALVEEVEARLKQFRQERKLLVAEFVAEYPGLVQEAEGRLRSTFAAGDYYGVVRTPGGEWALAPDGAAILGDFFRMEWRYVDLGVPGRLKTISKALFEQEAEKAKEQWKEALTEARQVLRTNLAELVDRLVGALAPGKDGKRKQLRKSTVENLKDFLETFSARDLTEDADLAEVVGKAKLLMAGVDTEALRGDESLRESLCSKFGTLAGHLEDLVENKPTRAVSFEDEV